MAARLKRRTGGSGFGTCRGTGLVATALLTAVLTLPMASTARAYRNSVDGETGTLPATLQAGPYSLRSDPAPAAAPPPGSAARANPPDDGQATLRTSLGRRQAEAVEKHIATLHRKLRITPLQEPLWQPLAAAMRDNVVELDRVYDEREKLNGSMSAVDDLKSYGTVQQIHARNVQSLVGPFQTLYDSFSPSQKKDADDTFRSFTDNAVKNSR